MAFLVPGLTTVRAVGFDEAVLREALAKECLQLAGPGADAEIVWKPGQRSESLSNARAVAVIADSVAARPLPHPASERPAQTYIPLRDWVGGWFTAGSFAAKTLGPLLVSPAVGDRPTRVAVAGSREWIFTRDPVALPTKERWAVVKMALVSGFGCGFFPLMPATLACAVMVPVALAVYLLAGWAVFFAVAAATFGLSTAASIALEKWAGRQLLAEDPREFVLDEFAGMAVTWMFLPPGAPWWAIVIGFFLFRVFDIFKWGVDWVEKLPISGKIVWDDVLAGLYAGVVLWGICRFL